MTENNFKINSAVVSDKGLSEKRPQNEDSYLELNTSGLFAVADGVGGAQAGDVASQMAVEVLGEAFINQQANTDSEDVMKAAIVRANEAIYQMSHDLAQLSTMATTIVALHLDGYIATIGHVGDSRLYRLDKKGNLHRETEDHSVVEEEVRAGRMTAAQAANHPSRNVISRALGAEHLVEVDLKTIMYEPQTTFLLCSDGITRHIKDAEIQELLSADEAPAEICLKMKEICYERGAEDNLTSVIAKVTGVSQKMRAVKNLETAPDFEEQTITAPRSSQTKTAVSATQLTDNKTSAQQSNSSLAQAITNYKEESSAPETIVNRNLQPADFQTTNTETANPVYEQETKETNYNVIKINKDEEKSESGLFGKVLSLLSALLLGGILGAGAYYFWAQQNNKEPDKPEMPPMQSVNVPFSTFENNRRNVDKDPANFISANAAAPQDAEDYYLLGRAYLLNKKYPEAKNSFEQAKNRLSQADEANAKILPNEIALGLAIINNPFSQSAFETDLNLNNPNSNTQNNSTLGNSNSTSTQMNLNGN